MVIIILMNYVLTTRATSLYVRLGEGNNIVVTIDRDIQAENLLGTEKHAHCMRRRLCVCMTVLMYIVSRAVCSGPRNLFVHPWKMAIWFEIVERLCRVMVAFQSVLQPFMK